MLLHRLWKKFAVLMIALSLGMASVLPRAEAVDAWAAAAQALGVFGAYKSALSSILNMGNNANAQIASMRQDIAENGADTNPNDLAAVDSVMNDLVTKGDYVLRANSLPFIWRVNNSSEFNAACYPTNYISINRALVRGLNLDRDELAAVFAHEMTHGLEQHSASNYAKAVAQYYGMSFLNMDAGLMDWGKLNSLAAYSIAKNVTLPTEYDADEGGFYILTSAGFNPGAGAAAMARMSHYLTYETQNILEHQYVDEKENAQENYSDHPDTDKREQKLSQMMTDYGAGHVTVKNQKDIYIDGQKFLTADWTSDEYDNTIENAYYIAGAIAKAFHDYDNIAAWNFRTGSSGKITCLSAARVNKTLQDFLTWADNGARLQELVARAYAAEKTSGARQKLKDSETARQAKIYLERQAVLNADTKFIKKMRENGDIYNDNAMVGQADFQLRRVFNAANDDSEADSYAIYARTKALSGDFAGALQAANHAVALDKENVYTYLNRADVYHMQGDSKSALADLKQAQTVDSNNIYGYLIAGQIYDEIGDSKNALAEYIKAHQINSKAFRIIPENYLQQISAKDYKTLQQEKKKARDILEQTIKDEQAANSSQ